MTPLAFYIMKPFIIFVHSLRSFTSPKKGLVALWENRTDVRKSLQNFIWPTKRPHQWTIKRNLYQLPFLKLLYSKYEQLFKRALYSLSKEKSETLRSFFRSAILCTLSMPSSKSPKENVRRPTLAAYGSYDKWIEIGARTPALWRDTNVTIVWNGS